MRNAILSIALAGAMLAIPAIAGTDAYGVERNDDGTCTATDAVAAGDYWIHDRPGEGYPDGTGLFTGAGTWLYREDNGIPGLQVGGRSITGEYDGAYDDCTGYDALIF